MVADHRSSSQQLRPALYMRWHELLFLHWQLRPEVVRPLIPRALELDTFDGWCWIGVVPFWMSEVRPRYFPFAMSFPELNVRTYVRLRGRSGVWFFSLDAANRLAVTAARWLGMPYYRARMSCVVEKDWVHYRSTRVHQRSAAASFDGSYRPTGPAYLAAAGSLDHWLTERYCLYASLPPSEIVYGEVSHEPWSLQPVEVDLRANTMAQAVGIDLPDTMPICQFARYQEVVASPIVSINKII